MIDNKRPTDDCGLVHLSTSKIKHYELIRKQVETAGEPGQYEIYEGSVSGADDGIQMFCASRRGDSHISSGAPCQDYCLVGSVNGCSVLADADGVSSCKHSDVGSRLACTAALETVRLASEGCTDEKRLVRRLMSVSFRERLVSEWVKAVMRVISEDDTVSEEDRSTELLCYGSTLMLAVITETQIITYNIGDGQILVFNDDYGIKLRAHLPKESSKVRCLANATCAREDLIAASYPRDKFNGVLLCTDGMYECLENGNHLYLYALQLKERFLSRDPAEPYQPFCYKEAGEPYKDFSKMRTYDDCSVALALDSRSIETGYKAMASELSARFEAFIANRYSKDSMSIYARKASGEYTDINVLPKASVIEYPTELGSAILESPCREWSSEGLVFSEYPVSEHLSLELMHSCGLMRYRQPESRETEETITVKILYALKALNAELSEKGLTLGDSALFNLFFDGKQLHIRREALAKAEENEGKTGLEDVESCFAGLLGLLESDGFALPIFDIGYYDRGAKLVRPDSPDEPFLRVVNEGRVLSLRNIGTFTWRLGDGSAVLPEGTVPLADRISITLTDENGTERGYYTFTSRKYLLTEESTQRNGGNINA